MNREWKADRMAYFLLESGRTKRWIAKYCGISEKTLGNVLRGDKPSLPVAILLAQAVGCNVSEIYPETEPQIKS